MRDNLARHPRPYLDYQYEYPVLGGALSYLLGFAPSLRLYYAATYAQIGRAHV